MNFGLNCYARLSRSKPSHMKMPITHYASPKSDAQSTPLSLERIREPLHVFLQVALVAQELNVGTVNLDATRSLLLQVLVAAEGSEAPVLADDDLLAAGELVLRSAEGLKGDGSA
jgi:hypothetical protein